MPAITTIPIESSPLILEAWTSPVVDPSDEWDARHPHAQIDLAESGSPDDPAARLRVIGGGASCEYSGPGVVLTSMYPNFEPVSDREVFTNEAPSQDGLLPTSWRDTNRVGRGWHASAKDHGEIDSSGQLTAWCFAIRVDQPGWPDSFTDANGETVLDPEGNPAAPIRYETADTPIAVPYPDAVASLPREYVLIGGGARASHEGTREGGQLLTDSRPLLFSLTPRGWSGGWYVRAKQHTIASPGTVTAWAIGLHKDFLVTMNLAVNLLGPEVSGAEGSKYPAGVVRYAPTPEVRGAVVSGGAQATYAGAGCVLTQSRPEVDYGTNLSWRVEGKDHNIEDNTGQVLDWAFVLYAHGPA